MKMLTEAIKKALPALYSTEDTPLDEKKCVVKFFCPWNHWSWYAAEGEQLENGDWLFFGYVKGDFPEWGEFVLSELESVTGPAGLKIERDLHFNNRKFSEIIV